MTNVTSPIPSRARLAARRWGRAAAWTGSVLVVSLAILATILIGPVARDPTAGFVARKGRLAGVEVRAAARQGPSTVTELRLLADTGLAVDIAIRVPDGPVRPRPAVLLLGGKGTGRGAARLSSDIGEVVVAALSYPFAGDPTVKDLEAVLELPRIQRAVLDTVPAILLATDYLLEQPYVDANRLELVGVSLGAFLVSPAGVLDERIRRVWIVHGAGDPAEVIDHALRDDIRIRPLRRGSAALLTVLAAGHYLAPERWVGRISPRQVIVINARDDKTLPRASVEVLHAALREPCEVTWVDGPHVQPNRTEVIELLSAQILRRVSREAYAVGSGSQNIRSPCLARSVAATTIRAWPSNTSDGRHARETSNLYGVIGQSGARVMSKGMDRKKETKKKPKKTKAEKKAAKKAKA